MKMKHITAVVAFVITFGLCVLLLGVPENNLPTQSSRFQADNEMGQQIAFLLQEDDDNGRESGANSQLADTPFGYAEEVNQYVNHSEAIDDSNLPADFRIAWRAHLKAWRTNANFLKRSNLSNQKMTENEFYQAYNNQNREITETWLNVLNVARRYGVDVPPNVY
ncbi:MAG: hypothetical protein ACR2HG_03285 [Pyrinomonadaceae bacterium]